MKRAKVSLCIKTGRPITHEVICKLCHRRCPLAGKKGRKRGAVMSTRG